MGITWQTDYFDLYYKYKGQKIMYDIQDLKI